MFCRQPQPDAAHANGARVAHVSEPEPAPHQPIRTEWLPHASAAVRNQPADDECATICPVSEP